MDSPKKSKRSSYHHGNLREAILAESLKWIEKNGVESLSLREIAKKLGVTHSAPNKHFLKKEDLLAAMIEEGFSKFKNALLENKKLMEKDPKEAFILMGTSYLKFVKENPAIYRLMFSNVISDPSKYADLQKKGSEAYAVLLESIQYMQERNILKKGIPEEFANLIWSFTHGFSLLAEKKIFAMKEKTKTKSGLSDEKHMRILFLHLADGILEN